MNSKLLEISMELTFRMKAFPLDYILDCTLYKNYEGEKVIHCTVRDKINLTNLIVGQQTIRDGLNELFIISKINLTKIGCKEENITNEVIENIITKTIF